MNMEIAPTLNSKGVNMGEAKLRQGTKVTNWPIPVCWDCPTFALGSPALGDSLSQGKLMVCSPRIRTCRIGKHKQGYGLQELVRTQTLSRNIRKNGPEIAQCLSGRWQPGPAFQWSNGKAHRCVVSVDMFDSVKETKGPIQAVQFGTTNFTVNSKEDDSFFRE